MRILLAAAPTIAAYVPVDISSEMLVQEAEELRRDYPQLAVLPVEADFTQPFSLPAAVAGMAHTGFFPGSTIGNFEPHEACAFLRHAGHMLGRGSSLIIGVDLVKDASILNAAYDDDAGVTAKFNLNLLTRINRELGANFDLASFSHHAFYNSERHRIEMHLASKKRQKVRVAGRVDRIPRRRDDPHREQLQVHARTPSARWRAGRAGARSRSGPTPARIFPSTRWLSRTCDATLRGPGDRVETWLRKSRVRAFAPSTATDILPPCRSAKPIPGACSISSTPTVRPT